MNDVRDEALATLLDSAARRLEAPDGDRLDEIVRRGSRRRLSRSIAIAAALAVFVGAIGWAGLTYPNDSVIPADTGAWRTFASLEKNGWTMQTPPPWNVQELPSCANAPERIGVIVTNVDFEFRDPRGEAPQCEDRFVWAGFPRDGVALAFQPRGSIIGVLPTLPQTIFPITPDSLIRTGGIRGGPTMSFDSVVVRRTTLGVIRRYVGPDADPSDVAALDRMLATFEVRGPTRWTEEAGTHTTLHDERRGYQVSYPSDWVVADENLTPWLMSPSEILSLGTFPLRVSHDPGQGLRLFDAPVAPQALADMTPDDVFLSLQGGGEGGGFDARPGQFGPRPCEEAITGCEPLPDIPFRAWWFPFEDEGGGFYLFVAIGNDAPQERREQVWAVANSLTFEPNEP